jgi:hypothetical protein
MRPRHFVALLALCGTVALAGWGAARLEGFGSSGIDNTATTIGDRGARRGATSLSADPAPFDAPLASTMVSVVAVATAHLGLPEPSVAPAAMSLGERPTSDPELPTSSVAPAAMSVGEGTTADPDGREPAFVLAAVSAAEVPVIEAPLPAPPPERRVQLASLFTLDPVNEYPKPAVRPLETPYECFLSELFVDEYLWSLYERTLKVDTTKVRERIKVTVKHKGKMRTVTKTVTRLVDNDFTWKDPAAAQRAGMPLMEYVIGGMDPSFKPKFRPPDIA